jgi:hypothetical protein
MIVLDRNVLSELLRPSPEPKVHAWLAEQPSASLFTTTVPQTEILYGIRLLPYRSDDSRQRRVSCDSQHEGFPVLRDRCRRSLVKRLRLAPWLVALLRLNSSNRLFALCSCQRRRMERRPERNTCIWDRDGEPLVNFASSLRKRKSPSATRVVEIQQGAAAPSAHLATSTQFGETEHHTRSE